MLHARGIGKTFGPVRALHDVGLELRAGEVTAIKIGRASCRERV